MYRRRLLSISTKFDHFLRNPCVSKDPPVQLFWFSNVSSPKINLTEFSSKVKDGPSLKDFIADGAEADSDAPLEDLSLEYSPYLQSSDWSGHGKKVYFDVYGCQMNMNDTEIVWSVLKSAGYEKCNSIFEANVILVVTCAIREHAETKVWNKLYNYRKIKFARGKRKVKIAVLGCMAERLKHQILEERGCADVVAGPDSYRDLPRLLASTFGNNQSAVNVLLSLDETYADVVPVRLNEDSVSAFVSIMRGCDNMCTYCVVPFTRGRERSRPLASITEEVRHLAGEGVKEIILLGQNVNSYRDVSSEAHYFPPDTKLASGFKTVYKPKKGGVRFAELLHQVSQIDPEVRIRFTSPHPKDFPDEVLDVIGSQKNICNSLHLPAQSGNSIVLDRMRRGYTREAYLELVDHIKERIPNIVFSSDFICGFCGETEEQFCDTLSLIEMVPYNIAFLYAYSMREKTTAHRRYKDDVPSSVKVDRVIRMGETFRKVAENLNKKSVGDIQLILVEGLSRRSDSLFGRNDANIKVHIPEENLIPASIGSSELRSVSAGDYIAVHITESNSQSLKGTPLFHTSLSSFDSINFSDVLGSISSVARQN